MGRIGTDFGALRRFFRPLHWHDHRPRLKDKDLHKDDSTKPRAPTLAVLLPTS